MSKNSSFFVSMASSIALVLVLCSHESAADAQAHFLRSLRSPEGSSHFLRSLRASEEEPIVGGEDADELIPAAVAMVDGDDEDGEADAFETEEVADKRGSGSHFLRSLRGNSHFLRALRSNSHFLRSLRAPSAHFLRSLRSPSGSSHFLRSLRSTGAGGRYWAEDSDNAKRSKSAHFLRSL